MASLASVASATIDVDTPTALSSAIQSSPGVALQSLYEEAQSVLLKDPNPGAEFAQIIRKMRALIAPGGGCDHTIIAAVESQCKHDLDPMIYELISDELHARNDCGCVLMMPDTRS